MSEEAPPVTRVGRVSQVDSATKARLQAAINYIRSEQRKGRIRYAILFLLVLVPGAWAIRFFRITWPDEPVAMLMPLLFFGVLLAFLTQHIQKNLTTNYKTVMVRRIIAALGKGLTYSTVSKFSLADFNDMQLFDHDAEVFSSEDEVCGRRNAVTYTILEAEAQYTTTDKDGDTDYHDIFKGLVARLDFNKHFAGRTIVVSQGAFRILGIAGEASEARSLQIARMDSAAFEREFTVYASDQQEARYLLTPKLMELLLRAKTQLGGKLRASFLNDHLYIAVPGSRNRFELPLFGAAPTVESVGGELAEVIALADQLVDTLELETRIWSRV